MSGAHRRQREQAQVRNHASPLTPSAHSHTGQAPILKENHLCHTANTPGRVCLLLLGYRRWTQTQPAVPRIGMDTEWAQPQRQLLHWTFLLRCGAERLSRGSGPGSKDQEVSQHCCGDSRVTHLLLQSSQSLTAHGVPVRGQANGQIRPTQSRRCVPNRLPLQRKK